MKKGKLQCKDIPDLPILKFLDEIPNHPPVYNRGFMHDSGESYGNWVGLAMPQGMDYNLIRAKMSNLIKKGLVEGCTCGCRGDFYLTEKGKHYLEQHMGSVNQPP